MTGELEGALHAEGAVCMQAAPLLSLQAGLGCARLQSVIHRRTVRNSL
jgi:hypothetical protein